MLTTMHPSIPGRPGAPERIVFGPCGQLLFFTRVRLFFLTPGSSLDTPDTTDTMDTAENVPTPLSSTPFSLQVRRFHTYMAVDVRGID